ncbi:hypothetical protein ATANTOWER_020460 [Ataeniobius toweri]|uniref:Uncharacterized protein n=1 Tax=Ataeniobius toweri TaxID=208326 RepID=A0ABU7AGE3_9TELE|nr:hypothetical protein [Ataeniobius toweri]
MACPYFDYTLGPEIISTASLEQLQHTAILSWNNGLRRAGDGCEETPTCIAHNILHFALDEFLDGGINLWSCYLLRECFYNMFYTLFDILLVKSKPLTDY